MPKLIIGILIGVLIGGILTFLMFVGVPRSAQVAPGEPIKRPDASLEAGAAELVLKQDFFNSVLETIFRDMNDPVFQLGLADVSGTEPIKPQYAFQTEGPCDGRITILPEGSGVATGVKFENGQITAPLAFSGNYNSPLGCLQFTGWAKANLELRFDVASQSVLGRINVETVNLDGVNPLLSGFVTPIVQSSLNNKVNPIEILRGEQIAPELRLASTGGNLKANVKDVRSEVKNDTLTLYVVYAFTGKPAA